MAALIVTIILSIVLVLALLDAGEPEYRIRWFPGRKKWSMMVYDFYYRPLWIEYDWETSCTRIYGPSSWTGDYYSPRPGEWIVPECPVSYKFTDSLGRWRYVYRTSEGLRILHYDDVFRRAIAAPDNDDDDDGFF